jgi:oligogalacturonide lyase
MSSNVSRRFFLRGAAQSALFAAVPAFARGHAWERRFFQDPETNVRILQVTSFPTINMNLYFHSRSWTPDGYTFLFWSMTTPRRGGTFDLYRSNVEGTDMEQLTDGKSISGVSIRPDNGLIYFTSGNAVYTMDIKTLAEKQVAVLKNGTINGGIGSFTDDGRRYCFNVQTPEYKNGIGYLDTTTNKITIIPKDFAYCAHLQIEPREGHLFHYIGERTAEGYALFVIDENGQNEQALPILDENGHEAWLGPTGKIYSALRNDQRGIMVAAPGDRKPVMLVTGPPSFWHPGCDPTGKWIVSDTSWPDDGLQLICVETGKLCRLARSESQYGHSQWSHPHPCVSPDAKYVLFNSTRTGVPHVYVAAIPDEMKKKLQVPFQPHVTG